MSALERSEVERIVRALRGVKCVGPLLAARAAALANEIEAHAGNPRRAMYDATGDARGQR